MPGLREQRKDEKRQTIVLAARKVFHKRGFAEATTIEIAKRAGIGTGTLYRYAADKSALLLMAVDEELADVTRVSIARIADLDERTALEDRLVAYYQPRIAYWASDFDLARMYAQIYASRAPEHFRERASIAVRQQRLLAGMTMILKAHAAAHGLALGADARIIARTLHSAYVGELHPWLGEENPQIETALARLRESFRVVLYGAFRSTRSGRRATS